MLNTIKIGDLPTTVNPQRNHSIPAMREGIAVGLRVEQILSLLQSGDIPNGGVTLAKLAADARAAAGQTYDNGASGLAATEVQAAIDEAVALIAGLPTPAFTKFFESAEQTITAAGAINVNHGLGEEPKLIQVHLVCKTAELGYQVDEKILIPTSFNTTTGSTTSDGRGLALRWNSTQVFWRYGAAANTFQLIRAGDGVIQGITNANFRVVVRAWA